MADKEALMQDIDNIKREIDENKKRIDYYRELNTSLMGTFFKLMRELYGDGLKADMVIIDETRGDTDG